MPSEVPQRVEQYLQPNESVLWMGKPTPSFWGSFGDPHLPRLFTLAVVVAVGAFIAAAAIDPQGTYTRDGRPVDGNTLRAVVTFIALVGSVGAGISGAALGSAFLRDRATWYAVTNLRLIIAQRSRVQSFQPADLLGVLPAHSRRLVHLVFITDPGQLRRMAYRNLRRSRAGFFRLKPDDDPLPLIERTHRIAIL